MRTRRSNLVLTQLEVSAAGGPSNTTQTSIENAALKTLTNATAKKIDAGLQWEKGSAMRVWRGDGAPTDLPVGGDGHDASQYVESSSGRLAERGITNEDLLREIRRSRAEFDQIRAEMRDTAAATRDNTEAIAALSERVVQLEQPST